MATKKVKFIRKESIDLILYYEEEGVYHVDIFVKGAKETYSFLTKGELKSFFGQIKPLRSEEIE